MTNKELADVYYRWYTRQLVQFGLVHKRTKAARAHYIRYMLAALKDARRARLYG